MPVVVDGSGTPTVDGHYFDVASLRALPSLADPGRYPDRALIRAQAYVEALIDRVCGTSFVHRTRTDTLSSQDIDYRGQLLLTRSYVVALTGVVVNGAPLDVSLFARLGVSPSGLVGPQASRVGYGFTSWQAWGLVGGYVSSADIAVTYVAGYSAECPADLSEAALKAARGWALTQYGASGVPDRAMSTTSELGTVQLATASLKRPTGYPDVDAVILGWADEVRPVGAW